MSAAIVPVGLSSTEVLPGIYTEINFAQGPSAGTGLQRSILVLANKLTTGSGTLDTEIYGPDTDIQLQTEPQMIALAGAGSEAHRMFRRMAAITGGNAGPSIYWLFVTESAGAKATGTITIATTATGNATHRTWVGDEFVDTGISTGDTAIAIATAIVAKINSKTHWPVTADNGAGSLAVVTLTAKQKGLRGNLIRFQAAIITNTSIGTTTTATADAYMSGGTTADSNATALTTISGRWFYYLVSAAEDATQLGALTSQVDTQAGALTGIRQRVVGGAVGTSSAATTVAVAINSPRCEIQWSEKSPWTPAELAANAAVIYALEEADDLFFRTNFIGYGNSTKTKARWKVPAPRLTTAWPTQATLRALLSSGVSPIGVNPTGSTYLVDRFTTRSLSGSVPETRIRDAHKVTICDRFADFINTRFREEGEGKVIGDDPPNGQEVPAEMFIPAQGRAIVNRTLNEFAAAAKIQKLAETKASSQVQRETNPPSRLGVRVPLATIDNFRQAAVIIDQVA